MGDLRNAKASSFSPVSGSAFSHAMISDGAATNVKGKKNGFMKMLDRIGNALRTHPTLDKRVAALEMAVEKGLVPKAPPGSSSSWSSLWDLAYGEERPAYPQSTPRGEGKSRNL